MMIKTHLFQFFILFVFIGCAFVWDFRPFGQRLFDLVVIGIACLYLVLNWRTLNFSPLKRYVLPGLILLYCLYGFINFGHKSSVVIGLMCGLYVLLHDRMKSEVAYSCLKYIYIINLAVFFLQFGMYHGFDVFVDLQTLFGEKSRIWHLSLFRPVGVFSEPHTYCLSIVLLSMMLLNRPEMVKLHLFGSFSLLISLSLWGMVAGIILPFVVSVWGKGDLFTIIKRYLSWLVILVGGFVALYGGVLQQQATFEIMNQRVASIWQDKSLNERFASHKPKEQSIAAEKGVSDKKTGQALASVEKKHFVQTIFGNGISTYPFLQGIALNGYAFIFHAGGILGIIIAIVLVCFYWIKASALELLEKAGYLILFLFILTSYPMVTYAFFWIFLSFIPLENAKNERSRP